VAVLHGLAAACWLSIATLDANSTRVGANVCSNGFKVDVQGETYRVIDGLRENDLNCLQAPYSALTFADFVCLLLFATASCVWFVYSAASTEARPPTRLALEDPFLASQ
jgi:hypothetical protein